MKTSCIQRWSAALAAGLVLLMTASAGAEAPYIGYVYPAGAAPGTTLTVTVGGLHLEAYSDLYVSSLDLQAKQAGFFRIYENRTAGRLKTNKERIEGMLETEKDPLRIQQMQRSLVYLDQEMEMAKAMKQKDKKNPEAAKKKQFNPQIAERLELELSIPETAAPGDYELRVVTADGLSNALLFRVGAAAEVAEKEVNDQLGTAEKLPALPVLVNGCIMPGDVDCFQLQAKKGQVLVFRADARSLVPYLADAVPGWFQAVLTLYDSAGREVAFNDDHRFDPDPVLIYEVPVDGAYVLKIHDSIFRGREDFVYRLSIGETPFIDGLFPLGARQGTTAQVRLQGVNLPQDKISVVAGKQAPQLQPVQVVKDGLHSNRRSFQVSRLPDAQEKEPNEMMSMAQAVKGEVIMNGRIDRPGDVDSFRFEGVKGEKKSIEVHARRLGSALDARIMLLDEEEHVLAVSDDVVDKGQGLVTHHADARIDLELPADGVYYVRLDDVQQKGGAAYAYRLKMGQEEPDFQLRVLPSSLRLPRGGSAVLKAQALRSGGFSGPIEITLAHQIPGLEVQPAVIPEGIDIAGIRVSATEELAEEIVRFELQGRATVGDEVLERTAVPAEDRMQAFLYRHLVPAGELLARVVPPDPMTLTITATNLVEVRPGQQIAIPASLTKRPEASGGVKLALKDAPEWLILKTKWFGPKSEKIVVRVDKEAVPGTRTALQVYGILNVVKKPEDPDFHPVLKYLNKKQVTLDIESIPVAVIE